MLNSDINDLGMDNKLSRVVNEISGKGIRIPLKKDKLTNNFIKVNKERITKKDQQQNKEI